MSSSPSPVVEKAIVIEQSAIQPTSGIAKPWQAASKPAGYGLPCSRCRTYYSAGLSICPVCKSTERVSAAASAALPKAPSEEVCPDPAVLEEERERFLREFKVQLLASKMQPQAATSRCTRAENHPSGCEATVVCQSCYDRLQERVDVLEAAFHIDLREAAQIVYDAVWADSDSPKSYENAAVALLAELRKRSGVTPTFGLMKRVTD